MKILCLQLARFGDIYQTWPVLNALKRQHPEAQLHFLVRERFQAATEGCAAIDELKLLPSRAIFTPLFQESPNVHSALAKVETFISELRAENYDRIVNLSFSPASSFLVDAIARSQTVIAGYTRYRDGFLAIPDDPSAYVYAQVGVDRANRIHLTDLFGLVACVELQAEDFRMPVLVKENSFFAKEPDLLSGPRIVVHIGASDASKVCEASKWGEIVRDILAVYTGRVILVGGPDDTVRVPKENFDERVVNLVGRTQVADLPALVAGADAVLGCDSMVMHVASLTDTPTLNLTFPSVRFWETGPRATRSRCLWFENPTRVDAARVAVHLVALVNGAPAPRPVIERTDATGLIYELHGYDQPDFSWQLTRALYMDNPFPVAGEKNVLLGFTRLAELAHLGLEQINLVQDKEKQGMAISILNEIDGLITQIAQLVPAISPVTRWFQCEKLRIGPGRIEEVITATRAAFQKLIDVCQVYQIQQTLGPALHHNDAFRREDLTWKP